MRKEVLAAKLGLSTLLEKSLERPLEAMRMLAELRPEGVGEIRNREEAMLAYCEGRIHRSFDRFEKASTLLTSAADYAKAQAMTGFAADCEMELASCSIAAADADAGIPHAEEAHRLSIEEQNPVGAALAKQLLGTLLAMNGEDERSIQYYIEAIETLERLAPALVHRALNNYSHHFFKRGDTAAGLALVQEAYDHAISLDSRAVYKLNIAKVHLDLGDHASAMKAAQESIELAEAFGSESAVERAKAIYAHAFARSASGDHREAKKLLDDAERCFGKLKDVSSQALNLVYRAKLAALEGKCSEAISCLQQAQSYQLNDRVLWDLVFAQTMETVQQSCANWADAYSALKQLEQVGEKLRKAESTRLLYANPIGSQRQYAMKDTQAESLKGQLDQRMKELVTVRQESAAVKRQIDTIVQTANNRYTLAEAIKREIRQMPEGVAYASFQREFVIENPGFIAALNSMYPTLTEVQIQVSCLTRAGLRSPAAAKMLNLSVRTVQNHRYRIKKVFGLEEDDSLYTFLKRF